MKTHSNFTCQDANGTRIQLSYDIRSENHLRIDVNEKQLILVK